MQSLNQPLTGHPVDIRITFDDKLRKSQPRKLFLPGLNLPAYPCSVFENPGLTLLTYYVGQLISNHPQSKVALHPSVVERRTSGQTHRGELAGNSNQHRP